jgi:general secretion pathway protein B
LKKSETERQRQTVPGLMDTRITQRRSGLPLWAVLLGLLLAVNIIVLVFVLMRSNRTAATTIANAPGIGSPTGLPTGLPNGVPGAGAPGYAAPIRAPSATPTLPDAANGAASEHFSPLDPNPVYAPEIPVTAADSPSAESVPRSAPPPLRLTVPRLADSPSSPHLPRHADPLLTDEDAKADSDEVLPTINELNLSGSQALPELHLDVHVYGTKPSERFVYINMRKYHEGTTLQEGPTVEHIRRDGVILNFHGLRFILPRQS